MAWDECIVYFGIYLMKVPASAKTLLLFCLSWFTFHHLLPLSIMFCCDFLHRCRLPGLLWDSGGEQLSSPEGADGEAEGDRLPEEEAGGERAGHPATREAHQVSRCAHAHTHTHTQINASLGNNVSHIHVTYKLHACKSYLAQMDVVIEVHMQVISAEIASHVVTKSLSLVVCVCVCLYGSVSVLLSGECVSPESLCGLSAPGSESSADVDVESSAAEADQDMPDETG